MTESVVQGVIQWGGTGLFLWGGGQLVEVTVALTCAEVACPDINWVDE
jgi:hypothetical protein